MSESIDKYIIPRFLLNEIYPYSEGIQVEFKKSFHINQHYKYRETICAFLNTNSGIIIYGIKACGYSNTIYHSVNGITISKKSFQGIITNLIT